MGAAPEIVPLLSMAAITETLCSEAKRREDARAQGINPGPVTGMRLLDSKIGDCFEPGLHLVHGAPGSGKSALALPISLECVRPGVYASAELRPPVIARRLIARTQRVPLHLVRRMGKDEIYQRWQKVVAQYPMFGVLDARKSAVPVTRMREAIDTLRESHGRHAKGLGALVIVDSLHTWSTRTFSEISEERERLDVAIEQLELLASLAEIAVIAVCERNRMARKDSGQSGMKGTGRLEYAGETVMGMDEATDGEPPPGMRAFCLHISKNREGEPAKLPIYFNGAFQRHDPILDGMEGSGF